MGCCSRRGESWAERARFRRWGSQSGSWDMLWPMPQGWIHISKIARDRYWVSFIPIDGSRGPIRQRRDRSLEDVRNVLTQIGVAADEIDKAVREAAQKSAARLDGYSLTNQRADELEV